MYLLNDKHSQYEYICYHRINGGQPFLMNTFDCLADIYGFIEKITKRHDRYHQIYYIDNDFFDNYYNNNVIGCCFYYKFLRRKVNDWEEFSTKENNIYNNLLYFHKCK